MRQDDSTVRKAMRPDLGASTPEPSLSEIVLAYYRTRFPETRAKELANAYFKALESSPADGAGGVEAEVAVIEECARAIDAKDRLLRAVLRAIDTGRSEPLFIVRDQLRNHLEDEPLTPTETGEQGK